MAHETLRRGPLHGFRILELAGIGPAPFCGMMLADMGAEVIRIDRPGSGGLAEGMHRVLLRNRRTVALDLKHPDGIGVVLRMCRRADAIFEGFRPGVVERLGIGPDACSAENARIVYGRMTGWDKPGLSRSPRATTSTTSRCPERFMRSGGGARPRCRP